MKNAQIWHQALAATSEGHYVHRSARLAEILGRQDYAALLNAMYAFVSASHLPSSTDAMCEDLSGVLYLTLVEQCEPDESDWQAFSLYLYPRPETLSGYKR